MRYKPAGPPRSKQALWRTKRRQTVRFFNPSRVLELGKTTVRPERLFALRAHPFGVALRAINLACGQVVELGLLSAGSSN
jgi:hypothetical protein